MKRFGLMLAVVTSIAMLATSAQAADGYFVGYGARRTHSADHANLAHRAQHRQVTHHNAHHAPLTRYQHSAVHANLNHQASHDQARHHAAHDSRVYVPSYRTNYGHHGVSVHTPIGSFWFGH
jgi:hypothetical protein